MAVKQAIPPQSNADGSNLFSSFRDSTEKGQHQPFETAPDNRRSIGGDVESGMMTISSSHGTRKGRVSLKGNFIREMRQLSKLRHPCITTVMGAVIEKGMPPMIIMEYMDHGSL